MLMHYLKNYYNIIDLHQKIDNLKFINNILLDKVELNLI